MRLSNKQQVSNYYIKGYNKPITKVANSNSSYDEIARECYKPLRSRLAVNASKVYKANNYDIVNESQRLYRLQCKYNTCDFKAIELYKQAQRKRIENAIEERERKELAKRNAIAKAKAHEPAGVKVFNKNTFQDAFAFHRHSNIIKMAMG